MDISLGTQHSDNVSLWENFHATHCPEIKRQLTLKYIPVVKSVLRNMSIRTAPPLEEQDLIQMGYIGLNDAIDRFDHTRGIKFETYAQLRIRGVIVDELRRLDWVPRTVREHVARYRRTEEKLQQQRGSETPREEVLEQMSAAGVPVDGIWNIVQANDMVSLQSHRFIDNDGESVVVEDRLPALDGDVLSVLIRDEMNGEIMRVIRTLPDNERVVLELHYYKNVTFQDVADLIGVTGARISQIHKKAIATLKDKLRGIVN